MKSLRWWCEVWILWKEWGTDLTKLVTLSATYTGNDNECFGHPRVIVLESGGRCGEWEVDMRSIMNVVLGDAFISTVNYTVSSERVELKWWIDVGELANHPLTPSDSKRVTVCSRDEVIGLSNAVTHITVSNKCGNDESLIVLDMSRFVLLLWLHRVWDWECGCVGSDWDRWFGCCEWQLLLFFIGVEECGCYEEMMTRHAVS